MNQVRVRQARQKNWREHLNWRVEQIRKDRRSRRVFIYAHFWQAQANADRIARHLPIYTYGLRGFHIEYL